MDLKKLEEAATEQFSKHNLISWTFGLAKSKRRLGVCKHRTKRIEISEYSATHNSDEAILDTLLHEIAHAIDGPKTGHGPVWKEVAVRIGATPLACDDSPDTVVQPAANANSKRRHTPSFSARCRFASNPECRKRSRVTVGCH